MQFFQKLFPRSKNNATNATIDTESTLSFPEENSPQTTQDLVESATKKNFPTPQLPNATLLALSDTMEEEFPTLSTAISRLAYTLSPKAEDYEKVFSLMQNQQTEIELLRLNLTPLNALSTTLYPLITQILEYNPYGMELPSTDYLTLLDSPPIAMLHTAYTLFTQLKEVLPQLFTQNPLAELYTTLQDTHLLLTTLQQQSQTLKQEEEALSTDIINYTNTVNELRVKYRLSVDWNGKKPSLMNLGQQLSQKREEYLNRENQIQSTLTALYQGYPTLHKSLHGHCLQFTTELQKGILQEKNNAESDNMHNIYTKKLELLNEYKQQLEQCMNRAK